MDKRSNKRQFALFGNFNNHNFNLEIQKYTDLIDKYELEFNAIQDPQYLQISPFGEPSPMFVPILACGKHKILIKFTSQRIDIEQTYFDSNDVDIRFFRDCVNDVMEYLSESQHLAFSRMGFNGNINLDATDENYAKYYNNFFKTHPEIDGDKYEWVVGETHRKRISNSEEINIKYIVSKSQLFSAGANSTPITTNLLQIYYDINTDHLRTDVRFVFGNSKEILNKFEHYYGCLIDHLIIT